MQVLLQTDSNIEASQQMADHLKSVAKDALDRFGERITRVEAHLADVNGHSKTADNDIHCTLEARLTGLEPVIVKESAGSAHQAIDGAMRKLKRAVAGALEKHEPRSHRTPGEALAAADEDLPA
ncbi:HPF/RaiA family ribosome-associated protein [Paucibacter sp. TC2R-5]|uniref:HPF/RaiA family ribosome-associated protein n=1 Tax=Paucibacter sp. TC2R-5 TaxID=2893555 RepID=UPI0021E37205|nr:HPF/RaiA family ribosome-associated protein [Paucibacter sp. TC2R-5]MCV2358227.1 HPF/RaiA family ribosome-associated protein [Paucibacter sp. TC2R-5]